MCAHVLYYRVIHSGFAIPEKPFSTLFLQHSSSSSPDPQAITGLFFFGSVILPAIEFHVVEIRYVDFPLLSSNNKDSSVFFSRLDHSCLFKSPNSILLY